MNKYLPLLIVLLFALPSVFSTYGVFCTSDSPAEILSISTNFDDGDGTFLINLANLTEGEINIVSVYSEGALVIEEYSDGLIGNGGNIIISGTCPPEAYPIREQILLTYIDQRGHENEVNITCSGTTPNLGSAELAKTTISFFILTISLFVVSIIALFYGRKRGNKKIKHLGCLLLIASAFLFLFFILLLFTNA